MAPSLRTVSQDAMRRRSLEQRAGDTVRVDVSPVGVKVAAIVRPPDALPSRRLGRRLPSTVHCSGETGSGREGTGVDLVQRLLLRSRSCHSPRTIPSCRDLSEPRRSGSEASLSFSGVELELSMAARASASSTARTKPALRSIAHAKPKSAAHLQRARELLAGELN